ncbi:MAG: leucine-rich repeat domain-containing protein [Thermoguttaceae bacterium]|jgi:Leucine-rich repeat (LRR) protein
MNDVVQLLCVVVSLTGGIHCVSLLRHCRKPAASLAEPLKSPSKSARWRSVREKVNWYCEVILATTFLTVAGSLLVGFAYRLLPLLWEEPLVDRQMRQSVETVSIQGCPAVIVDYDTCRPGRPIVGLDCFRKPISDCHLRILLNHAPKLEYLNLAYTQITDEALCELRRVPKLQGISLEGTRIGDLRLDRLAKLTHLESLTLDGTDVTDKGLRHLAELKSLCVLCLTHTAITDAGLEWLGRLENLQRLELKNTRATEAGVNCLKQRLPNLTVKPQ